MLIVLLDYSHSMLTSSCCMIFYLLLYIYIIIVTYFIHFDTTDYIGLSFCLLEHPSLLLSLV